MAASGLSERQREILDAARELLVDGGIEAVTMRRIADRVGIKPPSLYKHFRDKRALEVLLIADTLAGLAETLEAAGPALEDVARAYRGFALENPQRYRLATERPLPRDDLPPGLEARAAAPILAALGDPELARAAWAFAHGMVVLELAARFPGDADLAAAWSKAIAAFSAAAAA